MNKKNRGEKIVLKVCLRRYSTLYKILKLKIDQNGLLNGGFCCKMFYFRCSSFWKWFESLSEEKCHGKICEPRVVLLRFLRDRTSVFDWPHKILFILLYLWVRADCKISHAAWPKAKKNYAQISKSDVSMAKLIIYLFICNPVYKCIWFGLRNWTMRKKNYLWRFNR